MPVNEKKIRKGNVVFHNENMVMVDNVTEVGINNVNTAMDEGTIPFADLDMVRCIPDMLKQFGFKYTSENTIIIGQGKKFYQHPCGMVLDVIPDGTFRIPGHPMCVINTISQVQNLMLDLFNFDLVIQL